MSRHLVKKGVLVSVELRVLFLFVTSTRPDVRECRRIICFVRRINDDRLFLRLRGCMAPGAIAVVATATGAGRRKAASFWFGTVEIISTHMDLVNRWRPVVWPSGVIAW